MLELQRLNILRNLISKKGFKHSYLADKLGITKQSFSRKMTGKDDFKWKELITLSEVLQLDNEEKSFFLENWFTKC